MYIVQCAMYIVCIIFCYNNNLIANNTSSLIIIINIKDACYMVGECNGYCKLAYYTLYAPYQLVQRQVVSTVPMVSRAVVATTTWTSAWILWPARPTRPA